MIHILVARLLHMVYTESVTLDDEGDVNVSEAYLSILSELMSLAAAFNHFMDVVDSQVLRTCMALTNLSHLRQFFRDLFQACSEEIGGFYLGETPPASVLTAVLPDAREWFDTAKQQMRGFSLAYYRLYLALPFGKQKELVQLIGCFLHFASCVQSSLQHYDLQEVSDIEDFGHSMLDGSVPFTRVPESEA